MYSVLGNRHLMQAAFILPSIPVVQPFWSDLPHSVGELKCPSLKPPVSFN